MNRTLETKRLLIRPLKESDFEDFYEYAVDDELSRMYGFPLNKEKELTLKIFISFLFGQRTYALICKENQKMIGHLMIVPPELLEPELEKLRGKKGATLAFAINPAYQREGLMFEALNEVIEDLFCRQSLDYIHCGYYEFNIPSKNLQEKLGFQYFTSHNMRHKDEEIKIIDNILWKKGQELL